MYEACERLTQDRADELLKTLSGMPKRLFLPIMTLIMRWALPSGPWKGLGVIMMRWRGMARRSNVIQKCVSSQGG